MVVELLDHQLAGIFPLLEGDELITLAADIGSHGLREPIVLLDGFILDGRNRFRACGMAGVEPRFTYYAGENPLSFVLSLNLHRRHLDESQRSMVAVKIATLGEGRPSNTAPIGAVSQEAAAGMLKVGRRSVQRAAEVQERAIPEIVALVERGEIKVSAAAQVARLPQDIQAVVVEKPADLAPVAKAIRMGSTEPLSALGEAIRPALEKAVGAVIASNPRVLGLQKPAQQPTPWIDPVKPVSNDWPDWTGAVKTIAVLRTDFAALAREQPTLLPKNLKVAKAALPRLRKWIKAMAAASYG